MVSFANTAVVYTGLGAVKSVGTVACSVQNLIVFVGVNGFVSHNVTLYLAPNLG